MTTTLPARSLSRGIYKISGVWYLITDSMCYTSPDGLSWSSGSARDVNTSSEATSRMFQVGSYMVQYWESEESEWFVFASTNGVTWANWGFAYSSEELEGLRLLYDGPGFSVNGSIAFIDNDEDYNGVYLFATSGSPDWLTFSKTAVDLGEEFLLSRPALFYYNGFYYCIHRTGTTQRTFKSSNLVVWEVLASDLTGLSDANTWLTTVLDGVFYGISQDGFTLHSTTDFVTFTTHPFDTKPASATYDILTSADSDLYIAGGVNKTIWSVNPAGSTTSSWEL